jgi:hypothetical protein
MRMIHLPNLGSLLLLLLCVTGNAPAQTAQKQSAEPHHTVPRKSPEGAVFLASLQHQHDPAILRAVEEDADHAMAAPLVSVMDKHSVPPSGDKHDYMSLGRYFWPNPATPNHLPYVNRDGQTNPEATAIEDHANLFRMEDQVHALALGYFFTHDEAYAKRACLQLHVWFLDPSTRMNPSLKYAQAVLGVNEGRGIGILDARGLADVVDALALLAGSGNWTATDDAAMRQWFETYFAWLTTSKNGSDEAAARNNHGSWYDVQSAAIAIYLGKTQKAREIAEAAETRRIDLQIGPDGQQSLEEARTKSFGYCVFNLQALMRLATIAQMAGVDLWDYKGPHGESIRAALDYLVPFATGQQTWGHKNIEGMPSTSLYEPLLTAAVYFGDPGYERTAKQLGGKETTHALLLKREFATIPVPRQGVK